MLNVRKMPETGVKQKSGGKSTLSVGVKSLQVTVTTEDNSRAVVEKKIGKQKSEDREQGLAKNEEEKSQAENVAEQLIEANKELRIISLDEIAWHDTPDNCWFAIYDYVYDCTSFVKNHPGGDDVLLEYAGRDATLAFIGAGHSKFAHKTLERYLIGELPHHERLFRIADGVKVYGF